jgi:allantoinase
MGLFEQDYPRDLRGYAGNPPHARWPNQARIAVQFVLNYEEGAENHVLHGDAGSEQFLSDIIGAASYPDKHMSMDSSTNTAAAPGSGGSTMNFKNAACR